MRSYLFILFVVITLFSLDASAQRQGVQVYKILGVSVDVSTLQSGTESGAIIGNSGLRVGDEITIPGDQIRQAIVKLWALRIFSDVQILIENKVADGVYLLIKVKEYPRLSRVEIHGADDVDEDDIKKKITVITGQILTLDDVNRMVQRVKALYADEGHLLATVTTETVADDTSKPNYVVLKFDISEGPSVSIDHVYVKGSTAFDEGDLKGTMDDTHEKSWWQFWSHPKFDKKKFEADKDRIMKHYRKNGYLDAEILSDSTWYSEDKKHISVMVNVYDGAQYKVRDIAWEGSSVYKPEILAERLQFKKGDIFDAARFDENLHGNQDQTDVSSLYLDNGYLRFNLDPEIKRIGSDSLDITIHIYERNQFRIAKVEMKGNTKTHDNVIRRELFTRPGDFFSRAAIIRSMRQLSQLNYFNPEKLNKFPDVAFLPDEKSVNLTYEVEEKSSDNVNASVGYSGAFGVTGALGFTINNFNIAAPLEGGAGQIFNFEWQFGEGSRYRTFSVGFTEPWLYNTPTTLGVSLFDTRQQYVFDIAQQGISVRLGRRLEWPDNYFRGDMTFRFQGNEVKDAGGVTYYRTGKTTQYSVAATISRNSTDSPIFPTIGSNVAFTFEMSGSPFLPGNVQYRKYSFNADWFTPMFSSSRVVLYTSSMFGYLEGFDRNSNIPPIEYFYMGGTSPGIVSTTPLRGYEDRSVGPVDNLNREMGGGVVVKHTAELRLAVALNPIPIYLLGFAEGGNVFENFHNGDLFNLKRSYGFGARLLIQPIGLVGFDYGYGVDDVSPKDGLPDGWRFHFQFGRGF